MPTQEHYASGTTPTPSDTLRVIEEKILLKLATGGGGGGTQQVFSDSFADPNGHITPVDVSKAAVYFQESEVTNEWRWNVAAQAWYPTITP